MMRIWALVLLALQRASPGLAQPSVCRLLPAKPVQVITAADAIALTKLAVCPGANLTAIWHGSVALSEPIVVGNGTTLSISAVPGSTEAIIDGKNATLLFHAQGILQLTGLTLQNGNGAVLQAGAQYTLSHSRECPCKNATSSITMLNMVLSSLVMLEPLCCYKR
jgi:hypothetical protein